MTLPRPRVRGGRVAKTDCIDGLQSFSEPAERFLQLSGQHLMPAWEGRVPDVLESRSSHRVFHGVLLLGRGDNVPQSAAQENWSAEKVAARLESLIALRDPLFVDPLEKNPRDPNPSVELGITRLAFLADFSIFSSYEESNPK
jgi:hypothetical protein